MPQRFASQRRSGRDAIRRRTHAPGSGVSESASHGSVSNSPLARNIPLFYAFHFLFGFHFWLPVWFLFLRTEHSLSYTQIGLMEVLFGIATIIAEVPTGAIADRFGRRSALVLSAFGFAAGITLFAGLGYPLLVLGYALMAVTRTLLSGSGDALLFDTLRSLGRTGEYERHSGRARALATAGLLVATLFAGPIVSSLGFQAAILLSAVGMGCAGVAALLLREPPRREADFADSTEPVDEPPVRRHTLHDIVQAVRIVRTVRPVLWTILLSAVMFATLDLPDFFIQPFIRSHGIDPVDALDAGFTYSGLMLPSFFGVMLGSIIAAPLAARLGESRALPTIWLLGGLAMLPLLLVDHLGLVAALSLLAASTAIVEPLAGGYINRRIPSDQRATVLSVFSLVTAVMITVVIGSASALVDSYDFRAGFLFAFALLLVSGLFCLRRWSLSHRHTERAPMP
ncbi:MAG: MFS transporter [Chloroflexi bacterium]|nr:MFS transporter [Chloroflexota bacterium]MYF21335.1 MFS transporter [Chloroflexota bacterium]